MRRREFVAGAGALAAAAALPRAAEALTPVDPNAALIELEAIAAKALRQAGFVELAVQNDEHADRLGPTGTAPAVVTAGGRKAQIAAALEAERKAVAGYYTAVQKTADKQLLSLYGQIMANHGQHMVILRQALKLDPVPSAFEAGRPA